MRLTTWASCQSNIQLVCLNCGFAGAFPITHYIGQFGLVSSLILVLTPQSRCSVWPLNITFAYILFSMVLVWLLHSLWVLANPDFLTSKMALSDQKPFWACLAYSFNVKFSQHLQDRKKLYQTCPLVRQIIVDTYLFKKSWQTSCCAVFEIRGFRLSEPTKYSAGQPQLARQLSVGQPAFWSTLVVIRNIFLRN